MNQVLPVDARIRRGKDFSSVLRRGRRAARGGVVVHWDSPTDPAAADAPPPSESEQRAGVRAGFIVSKAVGNAVVRNRVKRRLRHAAADQMPAWPTGTDVVVRATPKAAGRDFAELNRDLADAIAQARRGREARRRAATARRGTS